MKNKRGGAEIFQHKLKTKKKIGKTETTPSSNLMKKKKNI